MTQEPFLVALYRLPEHPLHLTLATERPVWNNKGVIERPARRHHHRLPSSKLAHLSKLPYVLLSPTEIKTDVLLEE